MCRPPLPTTTTPKHACRPDWDLTAFAQLSAEQSHLRSSPGHSLTKGSWSEPGGSPLEVARPGTGHSIGIIGREEEEKDNAETQSTLRKNREEGGVKSPLRGAG